MRKFCLALSLMLIAVNLQAQQTILHCGRLVNPQTQKVSTAVSVIIEDNKISDVKEGYIKGTTADKVIDLKNKTVLPGLIDMHVHLEGETSPNRYLDVFTKNEADAAFKSVRYAETTLMAGFTTVRDLGGSGVNISLRNAISNGTIPGPRVYTAGKSIATTGGHADPTNGYRKDLMGDPGPVAGVANGADECRKAVRQRYKDGSDLIKITASGGVLSVAKSGENPQFTDDELKAVVETAKDYGLKVAAHCHGAEAMKRAIKAGVNSIEHGTLMDDEVIALMKAHGTYYVPTITAGKSVADSAKIPNYYPAIITPKAIAIGSKIQNTFARAYKADVKIAFGTDAGVFMHGKNYKEFEYMVEAGMPPMEAIRTATVHATDLLGVSDQLGVIAKGMLADIVAVEGDPLQNIAVMGLVKFVMKDGKVYKNN